MLAQAHYENIVEIARCFEQHCQEIYSQEIQADGKYQLRDTSLQTITGEAIDRLKDTLNHACFPTVIIAFGKCRVGSTALASVFAQSGIPSFYQPIKTIVRHLLQGKTECPNETPFGLQVPVVHIKETAGPYLQIECLFNPLEVLLNAGYPPCKIKLILLEREPSQSFSSWLTKWSDKIDRECLIQHFILSSMNLAHLQKCADENKIETVSYVYEYSKSPEQSIPRLFEQLGIGHLYNDNAIRDWTRCQNKKEGVFFPLEPEIFRVLDLHDLGDHYKYRTSPRFADETHIDLIKRAGLYHIYDKICCQCEQQLGIEL